MSRMIGPTNGDARKKTWNDVWVVRYSGHIVKSMASDINTGTAPCSNTAAAIDCLSPLVAIRLCDSLETAQPMLNTTLAIHLTSKKVDAFAFVTHRLIQGYRFRVGPYRFCGASKPHDPLNTTLVIPNFVGCSYNTYHIIRDIYV